MKKFVLIVIVAIFIWSAYVYVEGFTSEVEYVSSSLDHRSYLVRNLPDKAYAAQLLSLIRARLSKLVQYLKKKYPNDSRIKRLTRNFNSDAISDSTPDSKYTSYSVNKGEKIVFCLRSRDKKEKLVEENVMMFVALHELAHVLCNEIGHTEKFHSIFDSLLEKGESLGLYDSKIPPVKKLRTV